MKKLGFCILLVCLNGMSYAQNRPGIIPGDTGILEGRTKIELSDARRIPTEPVIETPEIKTPQLLFKVDLPEVSAPVVIQVPEAERMPRTPIRVLHQNYIKLGYGNNLSPLADVYFAMPGKEGFLDFNYHFLSANGPGYQDFSQQRGRITGRKYFSKGNLEAGFRYDRDGIYYFGYHRDSAEYDSKDSLRQHYQYLGGNLAFESKPLGRRRPYYRFEGEFYNFADRKKQSENWLNLNGLYRFLVQKNSVNIAVGYTLQQFKGLDSASEFTRHYIDINPNYQLIKKRWELKLGFNSSIILQENQSTLFKFFPHVEGTYTIEKDILSVFGEIGGNVQKNSFQSYASENPFLSTNPNLDISVRNFLFQAGIKGKLSGNTGFVARVLYQNMQNMPLYMTDTNALRSFRIVQDDVELIRLAAELTHQYSEKFRMALAFNYNRYDPQIQQYAWMLPAVDLKLNGTYNLGDKILVGMDVFVLGPRKATTIYSKDTPQTLKTIADFNLSLDYRWKKQISAFLKLNNLLGKNYQVWSYNPVYSFNLHAGLAIGF